MLLGALTMAALTGQSCWDLYDESVRRRAAASHPHYVQYDLRTSVIEDGFPMVHARAAIAYRDDGLARVDDDRFNGNTFVTDHVEPGPPELGPYGSERAAWLPIDSALPLIGDVHTRPAKACVNLGLERLHDRLVYHLVLVPRDANRPAVKGLWIDAGTATIWKVKVSGYLFFVNGDFGAEPLVDFEVEMAQAGPYVMVDHVTWSYAMPVFSQTSNLFGEYYFSNFAYPVNEPSAVFAIDRHM
jgi:hypothetical protein